MVKCGGCEHTFKPEDTVPYLKNVDGTYVKACYKCIQTWIRDGILWPIPFWLRKKEIE